MIIQRLHELSLRENLAAGLAFEKTAVPFMVSFDAKGNYLGIVDRRSMQTISGKGKSGKPKNILDNGKEILIPRAHGNTANRGFARYFVDTLPRVLPFVFDQKDEPKSKASRETFWKQIDHAADETKDTALVAASKLGKNILNDKKLGETIRKDINKLNPELSARCGLLFQSDNGTSLSEKPKISNWYANFFESNSSAKNNELSKGFCQITGKESFLPLSHRFQFKGIPGGLSTGTYLVSLDKDSFQSYGLDRAVNSGIGLDAAQSYSLALQALIEDQLPSQVKSSLRVSGNLFLFWTREPQDLSFMNLLDQADPEAVRALISSAFKGNKSKNTNSNDFYLLVLTGNAARIVVRDYLEAPLEVIQGHLAKWFKDLNLAFMYPGKNEKPYYSLYELVKATSGDIGDPLPSTPDRLLMFALGGEPLSDSILSACLRRIKVEGGDGCTRPRLSLVKLFLVRKGVAVTESLNTEEKNPAYLYGRLLEVFDEIQYSALGDVGAGVVDKFYGTFSAAPALLMARLFANAQNHLRKLKNEKPGAFVNLERKLTELVSLLPAKAPKGQLPLRDQGLFALGFYHQRAFRNQEMSDRKAAKEGSK